MPIGVLDRCLRLADAWHPAERLRPLTRVEVLMNAFQDVIATGEESVAREGKIEYPQVLLFSEVRLSARWKPANSGHQTLKCLRVIEPTAEVNPGEASQKARQGLFIFWLRP